MCNISELNERLLDVLRLFFFWIEEERLYSEVFFLVILQTPWNMRHLFHVKDMEAFTTKRVLCPIHGPHYTSISSIF